MGNSTQSLKVIFMGTPDFSVVALKALIEAGHKVVCVYAQPPRKSGRGQKLQPTPVHVFAESQGIEVRTPTTLKTEIEQKAFSDLHADVAVVVAYGLILPQSILDAPRLGCLNIHASLLPRWRGAAPIQRAIVAGDDQTGVTIMQMDAGLDTGPMLMQDVTRIGEQKTASDVFEELAIIGGRLIVKVLHGLNNNSVQPQPQPMAGVTYAKKIEKTETRIDWTRTATQIACQIRGLYPMVWFEWQDQRVRVLKANVVMGSGVSGLTLDDRLTVACGDGALQMMQVQPAGKSAMDVAAFLNGRPVAKGSQVK